VQRFAWTTTRITPARRFTPTELSSYGGSVNAGSTLTMTPYHGHTPSGFTYATGDIYYTTTAPTREYERPANGTATKYTSALTLTFEHGQGTPL